MTRYIEKLLSRRLFPTRVRDYQRTDAQLIEIVETQNAETSQKYTQAKLELDTRAWFREFWTRGIVTWLAFLLALAAFAVSIASFWITVRKEHREKRETKAQQHQTSGKR